MTLQVLSNVGKDRAPSRRRSGANHRGVSPLYRKARALRRGRAGEAACPVWHAARSARAVADYHSRLGRRIARHLSPTPACPRRRSWRPPRLLAPAAERDVRAGGYPRGYPPGCPKGIRRVSLGPLQCPPHRGRLISGEGNPVGALPASLAACADRPEERRRIPTVTAPRRAHR
jgi:hypothetical protein